MNNRFKSKTGEKQSLVRLAVIAGATLFFGTILPVIALIVTDTLTRNFHSLEELFEFAAIGGFLILASGTIAAWRQGDPICRTGLSSLVFGLLVLILFAGLGLGSVDKPVIYLYPPQEEAVTVRLDFSGKLTADYPAFDQKLGGWLVTAFPDGHLIDPRDGREYSYLFWEGENRTDWDLSTGFVVRGSDTRQFLQDMLLKLGLTPREYNEFIVYWYPKMQASRFNLIHFAGREYTDTAVLHVNPPPDSVIRVFMVWKPLATEISLPPQTIPPVDRHGFSVVEWGGTEVR